MNNFITNNSTKNLKDRLVELLTKSDELKFLVGFFYFSGLKELYHGIKNNPDVRIKVLVGLNVDSTIHGLVEYSDKEKHLSDNEKYEKFFESIKKSINSNIFDNRDFYEQCKFFLQLIIEDRLIIRKTFNPNHSKLYIFKLDEGQVGRRTLFITGSSNLTYSGLTAQDEFNVEISDYGFDDAEKYFDELWDCALPITEHADVKERLIKLIENQTHLKQISPFEAYVYVLKTYLETFQHKSVSTALKNLLKDKGYKQYKYQLDAVEQALAIIEQHNGVLVADVVGLGKTVIACMIAKHLRARGLVICPPALIGDKNKTQGWLKYLNEFELYGWEARSLGDLESVLEFVKNNDDIEIIIVDEAHRFRNPDTQSYELLKNICRNKKVILLTATPFNNKPEDILAMLKLFIVPKKSSITLENDLVATFRTINFLFDRLAYIRKNYNSKDREKLKIAKNYYRMIFGEGEIDLSKIRRKSHSLAKQIRDVIEPITIRRNRLDLIKNPFYKNEVKDLSTVEPPIEWFYELTKEQSAFYDEIISKYFEDPEYGGKFKGAIYLPFVYEEGIGTSLFDEKDIEKNREYLQQRNLFDIMRRLLVKRFESSFGAFEQSIRNFKQVTETVLEFITKTGNGNPERGEYILNRKLLENIVELSPEEIEEELKDYEKNLISGAYPKKYKRYKIEKFKLAKAFINDIKSDINLFDEILNRLIELKLLENDPKVSCLLEHIEDELNKTPLKNEPKRKIVIFSEYADTVKYVYEKIETLKPELANRTLVVTGSIADTKISEVNKNFDASLKYEEQLDDYDLLLSTDKLSEGFNLNRAGMVINYDIPWNPVRVIQRLGRINRISKKVFEKIYIVNFFPTEKGAELVRSREIAQNKMFMIHNTLGEDSRIFDVDEEPSPSKLYNKLMQSPEENEEESFYTKVLNLYLEIKDKHPELISSLNEMPARIKVTKRSDNDEMIVCFRKNRMYIRLYKKNNGEGIIEDSSLEEVLDKIKCEPNEKSLGIDDEFWMIYEKVKSYEDRSRGLPALSFENKALIKIDFLLRSNNNAELLPYKKFLRTLREDIIDYGTLSDYTLRRLANLETEKMNLEQICSELDSLKNELGEDYLEKEKQKITSKEKEIIIAIRNKPL